MHGDGRERARPNQCEHYPQKNLEKAFHSSEPNGPALLCEICITRGIVCNSQASVNRVIPTGELFPPEHFFGSRQSFCWLMAASTRASSSCFFASKEGRILQPVSTRIRSYSGTTRNSWPPKPRAAQATLSAASAYGWPHHCKPYLHF